LENGFLLASKKQKCGIGPYSLAPIPRVNGRNIFPLQDLNPLHAAELSRPPKLTRGLKASPQRN